MLKFKHILVGFGISLSCSAALAEGAYLASGLARVGGKETGYEYNSTNFIALIGYEFSENIAIEGETSFILADDTVSILGQSIDVGLTHTAVFLKGSVEVSEDVSIFARLGQSKGKAEAKVGGVGVTVDDTAFSYGFGIEFHEVLDSMNVRLDYSTAEYKANGSTTDGTVMALTTVFRF